MPAGIDLWPARYEIGATVTCSDGPGGELSRIVIDPIRHSVTHLIVEPHHRHALARLVPVGLAGPGGTAFSCAAPGRSCTTCRYAPGDRVPSHRPMDGRLSR